MTLNINEPTDQRLVGELPSYIRANRVVINANEASDTEYSNQDLVITAGDTSLTVGTDLSLSKIELIRITCLGVANIAQIKGGTAGQVKIFIFGVNTISFTDGVKSDGRLYLNQLPVSSSFAAQVDDVIALTNVSGDGAAVYGYWKELWRQISVK